MGLVKYLGLRRNDYFEEEDFKNIVYLADAYVFGKHKHPFIICFEKVVAKETLIISYHLFPLKPKINIFEHILFESVLETELSFLYNFLTNANESFRKVAKQLIENREINLTIDEYFKFSQYHVRP